MGLLAQGYRRKLRIWATNCGRDGGWLVELQGQSIAVLTEWCFEDMFWDSYNLQVVTDDFALRERMQTLEFWTSSETEGLVWRSCEFGEVADGALSALFSPFPAANRLLMRGLYLGVRAPSPWDRLVMWLVAQ